jgi:large subunit ribosomal protein L29
MKVGELLTELRAMSVDDLRHRARDLDEQVFRLRIQKSMGQAESANKLRPLRKERARVKTILREKGVRD